MGVALAQGGFRCTHHAAKRLAAQLAEYREKYPDGPSPEVLVASTLVIGRLHAHVEHARQTQRAATTHAERAAADAYFVASHNRLVDVWGARHGAPPTSRGPLSAAEQGRWCESMSDDADDDATAARHATVADSLRGQAAVARGEAARLLHGRREPLSRVDLVVGPTCTLKPTS